jgi:tryptophan synthase alpha chain
MATTRYASVFSALKARGEGAFVPFTVLGDPDPETSLAVLEAFAAGGADMLELGIAFSDPVADGPVIQGADRRALAAGVDPGAALDLVAGFRRRHPDVPVGLLVYANLVHRPGPARFYRRAAAAGVDSVLVADLSLEESRPFAAAARAAGVGPVFMATPKTSPARLERILGQGGPYLYVVSRAGVTGRDRSLAGTAAPLLRRVRRLGDLPALLGFGIGRPEHVRAAIAAGADGAISGSAVVEIIARHAKDGRLGRAARERLAADVRAFTRRMKKATRG